MIDDKTVAYARNKQIYVTNLILFQEEIVE